MTPSPTLDSKTKGLENLTKLLLIVKLHFMQNCSFYSTFALRALALFLYETKKNTPLKSFCNGTRARKTVIDRLFRKRCKKSKQGRLPSS